MIESADARALALALWQEDGSSSWNCSLLRKEELSWAYPTTSILSAELVRVFPTLISKGCTLFVASVFSLVFGVKMLQEEMREVEEEIDLDETDRHARLKKSSSGRWTLGTKR